MRIALYEPDIPQNTGNIFRLGACLGIEIDIIEPTGYVFDDKRFKDIWNDIIKRQKVMSQIEDVECFSNCTKMCKPHESNKMFWYIYDTYENLNTESDKNLFKDKLLNMKNKITKTITHAEFI